MFDLIAFHESTTNNGLLPVAPAPGGQHGYIVNGDDLQPKGDGYILKTLFQSGAIANFVEGNFGMTGDNSDNWPRVGSAVRDQTGAMVDPLELAYKFSKGEQLNCNVNHGNNAQVADCIMAISPTNKPLYVGKAPDTLPDGCLWITATGVTSAVANTWSGDVATYTYKFNANKKYAVYGLRGFSTTGYAFRILPQSGDTTFRPGWVLGDSNILTQPIYSDTPMYVFTGNAPPQFQKLCSSTDSTASRYYLLIKEL